MDTDTPEDYRAFTITVVEHPKGYRYSYASKTQCISPTGVQPAYSGNGGPFVTVYDAFNGGKRAVDKALKEAEERRHKSLFNPV